MISDSLVSNSMFCQNIFLCMARIQFQRYSKKKTPKQRKKEKKQIEKRKYTKINSYENRNRKKGSHLCRPFLARMAVTVV